MRGNKGFTLVEMMVAVLLLVVVSVPIMSVFYFGVTTMEKQMGTTQALAISRDTMQVIVSDLEKYSSNATQVSPEYSEEERQYMVGDTLYHEICGERYYEVEGVRYYEKELIIRDDDTIAETPKKVMYVYRRQVKNGENYNRVLIREVDGVSQVLLTDSQLSDKYYTDAQKRIYNVEHKEPVEFMKDDAKNRISVYLRIKSDNKADAQESEYAYTVGEGETTRQVLRFEKDGYLRTDDSEKFNLYQSSFTIESYFKLDNIEKERCLVNLVGSDGKSKVSVVVKNKNLVFNMGENTQNESKCRSASVSLLNNSQDCTTNMWRKFIFVYDDNKKRASVYLTKNGDGSKLDTVAKGSIDISTDDIFYGKITGGSGDSFVPIVVDKIYLGNTNEGSNGYNDTYHDVNGNEYYVYMYETKLWNKAINIDKYDVTKRLVGNEDGLLLYMKDDYKKSAYGDKVSLDIRNAVSNKSMIVKDVLASEELETTDKTTNSNIRNVLGY